MAAASSPAIHQYHLSSDKIILASAGYNYYLCVHLSVDKRRYDQVYIEAGLTIETSGPRVTGHQHCPYLHTTHIVNFPLISAICFCCHRDICHTSVVHSQK